MREDYAVEKTREGIELMADNVSGLKISFIKGLCVANPENPAQPRDYDWYVANVLNPLIEQSKISNGRNGPFDDRKFRYDHASIKSDTLEVALGANHYLAYKTDISKTNDELQRLHKLGIKHFNDQYAFLSSRAPGVAVIVITSEGSIFIGERLNTNCSGVLNTVAGHLEYRNIENVNLDDDIKKETKDEFGVEPNSFLTTPKFVGVYSHPMRGDLDFGFVVKVNKPDIYFSSGEWMNNVSKKEHNPLIRLSTFAEIEQLLSEGTVPGSNKKYSIMYSTRGALESITFGEIRN